MFKYIYVTILAIPMLLSGCAKDEIDPLKLSDDIVGHWQTGALKRNNSESGIYNYSFRDDGEFAYWYTLKYTDGTTDPNPRGDLKGEWTVFGEDKIGLSYILGNETKSEIITVIITGEDKNQASILDFSGDLRTYKRQISE